MTHALKTWPEYYKDIESGKKNFELRKFDRPFKPGDILLLQEWDNKKSEYTGKELHRRVTYILAAPLDLDVFGLRGGFCIMGMEEIETF